MIYKTWPSWQCKPSTAVRSSSVSLKWSFFQHHQIFLRTAIATSGLSPYLYFGLSQVLIAILALVSLSLLLSFIPNLNPGSIDTEVWVPGWWSRISDFMLGLYGHAYVSVFELQLHLRLHRSNHVSTNLSCSISLWRLENIFLYTV